MLSVNKQKLPVHWAAVHRHLFLCLRSLLLPSDSVFIVGAMCGAVRDAGCACLCLFGELRAVGF